MAALTPSRPGSLCDAFVSVSFSLKNNRLSQGTQIGRVLPLSSFSQIVYTHVTSTQIKSTALPAPRGLFHVSSLLGPLSSSPEQLLPCLLTRRFVLPGFELNTVAPRSLYSCKGWLLSIHFTLVRFIHVRHAVFTFLESTPLCDDTVIHLRVLLLMGAGVIFSLALLCEHMGTFLSATYLRMAGSEPIHSLALADISEVAASVSTPSAVSESSGGSQPHQRLGSSVCAFSRSCF